ncbi:uncharacterized protein LOC110978883 isoform X2 [Acanthaster planci]|uniref:Uncharacterized protein LOC110978883 isoform X2 n=1 Tax=Acanthaster planci TaxID=133434 RepID=A0A8B7Y9I5_ACAPL|nr:uncharacterized protein LOC110978883 isoform X2 [Acanthaster planci]
MKKLAVLGATGKTGQQAVQADVFSVDSLKSHFTGSEAVLSCLGRSVSYTRRESTFYCDTMKVITQAMREAGVRRLVCMTSWMTDYGLSEPGPFFTEWILKSFMRLTIGRILDDMKQMERYLIDKCQDINYTIVRPPGLTNGPLSGRPVECEVGQYVYSVSISRILMSRADVANFMLSTLKSFDFDQKTVAIAVK